MKDVTPTGIACPSGNVIWPACGIAIQVTSAILVALKAFSLVSVQLPSKKMASNERGAGTSVISLPVNRQRPARRQSIRDPERKFRCKWAPR